MKQPNLKARLISSVLVLVMMITSLLGTTFAWFTDLAVSGGNTIQVGSLKVGLYHKVGEDDWKSIKDDSNHKIFNYDKWEPGYTRFETLKIANHGNLALQYKLSIEVAGRAVTGSNGENLADVIDVYVVDEDTPSSWTYKGTLAQVMRNPSSFINGQLLAREENVVSIVLRMQTTAGNAYQGLDVGDIYVNLVATQWNYEKDSFDNPDYDKDAIFPELNIGGITVDVTTNYNNEVINTVPVSGEGVKATIPAGVKVDSGVNKLSLSVTEKENSDANLPLNDGEALRSLDVHISGVSKDNTKPMLITVEKAMNVGLNMGNYTLYHVENGVSNAMAAVDSLAELDAHNEFYYDPATGDVTLAMATFSEVAFVAETDPAWEGKIANSFAGGSGTKEDPYLIANADQLAYLGDRISNDNSTYGDKYYKLVADINLGGEKNANDGIIFYPIGYHKVGGSLANVDLDDAPEFIYHEEDPDYAKNIVREVLDTESTAWYTYGGAFKGVFDGNGNTISNIYQNTWQMKGNYDGNYWNSAMGVFGYVYGGTVKNLTVNNFSSDGEFTPTGVIAAYAAGDSTFENIAITNCNPRVYNTGNGGIIGIAGSTTNANDDHITLKNITVDNTNKISALWGSWDVACGGLVGMYRGNVDGSGNATGDTISFKNCHVSAQIDVYNDVCANYQYYAYRYSGMIIGSVRHNTTGSDGRTIPNMEGISASGCTVNYGDWNDYYYCEFEKNTMASYSEDYQFSRVPHSELNFTDSNGNGVVDADERSSVTGCKHNHTAAENHQAVYLPFYQLFTGYSWGVSSIGLKEYSGIVTNLGITEGDQQGSVKKFEGKVNSLENYTSYNLGDIFKFVDNGVKLIPSSIVVSVTNVDETNPVSATIVYNSANWEDTTIKFIGVGEIAISIQDYFFCTPTTITVNVTEHEHAYDNNCDTTCNVCGGTREVDSHVYDNSCDTTCNECGAERTIEHTVVIDQAVAPKCTATGLTEGSHCSVCGKVLVAQTVVPALGHKYDAVVTEPDCENDGYTTYTCSVCSDSYVENGDEAHGHSYEATVTSPTCTTGGYTTYTCSDCGGTYKTNEVAALGHAMVVDNAVAPTCTTTGLTEGSHCTRCDHKVAQTVVPALDHNMIVDNAVAPTCTTTGLTEGSHCSRCDYKVDQITLEALGRITTNFTGDFLYRVGNQNAVELSSLFNVGKRSVTVSGANVAGNASVAVNGTSLTFSGTGVVKVTLSSGCTCNECDLELTLEVVDATNLTSATGTIEGGTFVLLCNVNTSTYVNYWNCTLYGNGFTYSLKGAPTAYNSKQGHGVIITKNATLDNLVIVGDVYNSYGAYTNQDYYNTAIDVVGDTTIQNCYIANCAAPVKARSNVTIKNSTLYGGTVANLLIMSGTATLENVTTANYDDGRAMVGMGIVIHSEATETAKLVLNGTLTQYNFISESKVPTDTYAKNLHDAMFNSNCSQYQFGTSPNRYVNTGIISLTSTFNGEDITDNAKTGYVGKSLRVSSYDGYVYTQANTSGSVNNNSPEYKPTTQGAVPPSYSFDYTNKNYIAKTDGSNDYCYEENGKVNISMDQGDTFNWDTSILTIGKGITSYTVSMNGTDYTGKSITFNTAGDYTVTYTYTDDNNNKLDENGNITTYSVTYTKTVHITVAVVKATTKHAEFTFGSSNTASTTVTVGNSTYVMPNVSGTSSTIGSTTVSGQTIYYPIVEIIMSDGKTSHSSGWYAYFPVFSGAVTITDYAEKGTGDKMTPYNGSTTTMPSGLSIVGDPTQLFKYQSSSAAGSTPVVKSNKLVYSSASISANRNEYNTVIQYSYTDNAGATYYYYIGYHAPAQSYSSICLAPDTLITMANGTKKEIQDVRIGDMVVAWNFYTGKYENVPVSLLQKHETGYLNVLYLYFDDGTVLKVLGEHGIFDADLNTFIFIDEGDVGNYIGHNFVKQDGEGFTTVKLTGYDVITEYTTAYTILSLDHYNVIAEGMFTVTPAHVGDNFFNPFDVGEDMKYDDEAVKADIEKYGLYTYDDFDHVLTYEQFVALNLGHFKVSVGKGYITYDGLIYLIENFINNEDFNVND